MTGPGEGLGEAGAEGEVPPVPEGHQRIKCGELKEGYRDVPDNVFDPSQHALYDESDRVEPEAEAEELPPKPSSWDDL